MSYPNPKDYEPILDVVQWQATKYVNPDAVLTECVQLVLTEIVEE